MKSIVCLIAFLAFSSGLFAEEPRINSTIAESELTLNTSTGDIHGTLTVPNNDLTSPIVLIIAGSGPTDRDGNNPMGVHANSYKMLSASFAENGISSLRFDKRGIGKSHSAMHSERELTFETYINDVVAWISLLKTDKRFSSIFVLGHSEGSLIGMVAAKQSNVDGFISISGVGQSADKIMQKQLKANLPPQLLNESDKILESLRNGKIVSEVNPSLMSLFRPSVQPYMISWIKYDPVKEISKLEIPVLIVQGTTDIQVTVKDSKLLSAAKPDAKLRIIENMNHVLKESDSEIQNNMATYSNPVLPLKYELIEELIDFINTQK